MPISLYGGCLVIAVPSTGNPAIHWSCVHWHFSSRQNLLPCFPWSYEFLTIRKCSRPEWAKDVVVFETSKNQFGWIQIHLSKQLALEDKFQFFKFEVQKGNPTLTNETSWTNVRLVNYKDLAKGSAGDSLSDWWPIQCFDCSCCFGEKQANL